MTIVVISHPDCLLHDMGDMHPEQPARVQVIAQALQFSNLASQIKNYSAELATREQLKRVHDPDYIEQIFQVAPKTGLIHLDPDTAMNPHSLTAALRAAGAAVQAVDLVMSGKFNLVFCNVRPPGHHATRGQAMGFCFFNNVAVGVAHALTEYKLKRIAIIDFDVHHGNGTEDIFQNDERVMLCSSFQYPFYPGSGADTISHHILNAPLPAGAGGKEFREVVEQQWLPKLETFQPELIFFSAGFDAHAQDVMANLQFHEEDYFWVSRVIRDLAQKYAQGRMISMLEGGYALDVLGKSVVAHLQGCAENVVASP